MKTSKIWAIALVLIMALCAISSPASAKSKSEVIADAWFVFKTGDLGAALTPLEFGRNENPQDPDWILEYAVMKLAYFSRDFDPYSHAERDFNLILRDLGKRDWSNKISQRCYDMGWMIHQKNPEWFGIIPGENWERMRPALNLAIRYADVGQKAKLIDDLEKRGFAAISSGSADEFEFGLKYLWLSVQNDPIRTAALHEKLFTEGMKRTDPSFVRLFEAAAWYGKTKNEEMAKRFVTEAEKDPARKADFIGYAIGMIGDDKFIWAFPAYQEYATIYITPQNSSREKPYKFPDIQPGQKGPWIKMDSNIYGQPGFDAEWSVDVEDDDSVYMERHHDGASGPITTVHWKDFNTAEFTSFAKFLAKEKKLTKIFVWVEFNPPAK